MDNPQDSPGQEDGEKSWKIKSKKEDEGNLKGGVPTAFTRRLVLNAVGVGGDTTRQKHRDVLGVVVPVDGADPLVF